jgi:hypothetical protein
MTYAVVHKNRVIAGPMDWSQKFWTSILKLRHQITANIPGRPPSNLPYTIDENTRIHEVTEIRPEFNPMIEGLEGPTWNLATNPIQATWAVVTQSMNSARAHFKAQAAEERYRQEVSGTTHVIQGQTVSLDTSREGRAVFVQALTIMGDTDTANWKFPEGWLTINKPELASIVAVGAVHIQTAFAWERGINDQIDAAQTVEDLLKIEILPPPVTQEPSMQSPQE